MLLSSPGYALRLLTAALRGQLPREAEWLTVLDMANRGWLGPALYIALDQAAQLDEIPPPVRDYLGLLHAQNRQRNQRLQAQLVEAIGALNGRGIQPALLKGAIHLFSAPDARLGSRMISDLDISIAPSETPKARAALETLGYCQLAGKEMARSGDAAVIELHDKPSTRSRPYLAQDLRLSSALIEKDGIVVRLPSPTSRALHLIVHDMIKEGDYWRLKLDLRHLHDLAELANLDEGVDWHRISAVLADRTGRRALQVQAAALQGLFDVPIPSDLGAKGMTRLKHLARLIAATPGAAGALARMAGNLAWGLDRCTRTYTWRGTWDFSRRAYRVLVAPSKGSRL